MLPTYIESKALHSLRNKKITCNRLGLQVMILMLGVGRLIQLIYEEEK